MLVYLLLSPKRKAGIIRYMKKKNKILIALIAVFVAISAAVTVYAVGYDSESDPIVALSYITDVFKPQVESMIQGVKTELSELISGLQASVSKLDASADKAETEIKALESTVAELESGNASLKDSLESSSAANEQLKDKLNALESALNEIESKVDNDDHDETPIYNFEVVYLTKGQSLMATDACEVILRSGAADAVSPFDEQGLADYTSGAELLNGAKLTVNHLNLISRGNDGRGLIVTSDDAYLMVRGGYTIVEPQQ